MKRGRWGVKRGVIAREPQNKLTSRERKPKKKKRKKRERTNEREVHTRR